MTSDRGESPLRPSSSSRAWDAPIQSDANGRAARSGAPKSGSAFRFGVLAEIGDTAAAQTGVLDLLGCRPQQATILLISVLFPDPFGPTMTVSEPRSNAPLK